MILEKLAVREHPSLKGKFYISDGESHYIQPNLTIGDSISSHDSLMRGKPDFIASYTEEEAKEILAEFLERQTD